jgi:DNA-binding transcriptional regulator YhcF (GntR family)
MAGNGLNMKEIDEVKRLHKLGLGKRQIARTLRLHRNTVSKYLEELKEGPVLAPLALQEANWTCDIDWEKIRSEYLSGVPLNIIHEELFESQKVPVLYPGFWKQAKKKIALSEATMVRIFKPGERIEIDYADGIEILDPATGERRRTEFFVGVLCHSRYTFAEFTWSQSSQDFLQSHVNMFSYFGGTAQVLSPDNLKSAVTKAHRYDPTINQAYTRLADYYDVAVVPARVRTPKDKAIVERTIQIFQRWFFMRVRYKVFTSLPELNRCLREHLDLFHEKKHRIFKRTRKEMYQDEQPHLRALPLDPYNVATYSRATLSRDCHLICNENYYSAPHWLRGRELDVWATPLVVEIYSENDRVAVHARSKTTAKFITDTNHYPPAQQAYAEEDIQKIIVRAVKVGMETEKLIKELLGGAFPLKHFRRSQGIMALAWKYSDELLEEASTEANRFSRYNVQYMERVIKTRKGVARKDDSEIAKRSYNPHLRGINNIH